MLYNAVCHANLQSVIRYPYPWDWRKWHPYSICIGKNSQISANIYPWSHIHAPLQPTDRPTNQSVNQSIHQSINDIEYNSTCKKQSWFSGKPSPKDPLSAVPLVVLGCVRHILLQYFQKKSGLQVGPSKYDSAQSYKAAFYSSNNSNINTS